MSEQHAFVLTSSPANAAYEVGVMKALLRHRWGRDKFDPIDPYCYSGVSVGVFNAAMMVAGGDDPADETLERLERVWTDHVGSDDPAISNGIIRIRAMPTQLLDSGALADNPVRPFVELGSDMFHLVGEFLKRAAYAASGSAAIPDRLAHAAAITPIVDMSPMRRLVEEVVPVGLVRNSPKLFRATALDWDRGVARTFSNRDIDDAEGHEVLVGSMSLPVLMDPVRVGGGSYLDAAAIHDRPLLPAIEAAPDDPETPIILHVVNDDAQRSPVRPEPLDNAFATVYRLLLFAISRSVNADVARAVAINERLWIARMLQGLAEADGKTMDQVFDPLGPGAVNTWNALSRDLQGKRLVGIHRFRSTENRGFSLQHLERRRIQRMIDSGYDDAMRHDCEEAGCVDPHPVKRRARG